MSRRWKGRKEGKYWNVVKFSTNNLRDYIAPELESIPFFAAEVLGAGRHDTISGHGPSLSRPIQVIQSKI